MLGSQNQVTRLFGLEGDDGESESSHEIGDSESSHEIGGESESSHEIKLFGFESRVKTAMKILLMSLTRRLRLFSASLFVNIVAKQFFQ